MNRVRMFPWTKVLWFSIQAEGQSTQRQAILYRQYPFSEQKQGEAKIKVKETDPTWSQILLLTYSIVIHRTWTIKLEFGHI